MGVMSPVVVCVIRCTGKTRGRSHRAWAVVAVVDTRSALSATSALSHGAKIAFHAKIVHARRQFSHKLYIYGHETFLYFLFKFSLFF